ncbi:hypothetical protein VTK56DRAFT_4862 [Thermocarpiscus australiensis]
MDSGIKLLSWMASDKKARKRAIRVASRIGIQMSNEHPLVKTVLAARDVLEIGKEIYEAKKKGSKADGAVPKMADAVLTVMEKAYEFIPSMQVMARSFCDTGMILSGFQVAAVTVGIGTNIVLTYQGVQALEKIAAHLQDISTTLAAQTALIAQKDFPSYVYDMIRERLGQTASDPSRDHWFFLYHPDNDWYPGFYHLLEEKPLGERFCGYTNQIDTIFVFMLAARQAIQAREKRKQKQGHPPPRPVKLHLLIPAYQPILIAEALKIPDEIGDFLIEGRTNSNKPFVWLNLPPEQRRFVVDIGHWEPPTLGWWENAMSKLGFVRKPPVLGTPRVLGTRQVLSEDDDNQDGNQPGRRDSGEEAVDDRGNKSQNNSHVVRDEALSGGSSRDQATPLHHRSRPHSRRRHRLSPAG